MANSHSYVDKKWKYLSFALIGILAAGGTVSLLPQANAHITTNVQHMLEHIYNFVDGIEAKTDNLQTQMNDLVTASPPTNALLVGDGKAGYTIIDENNNGGVLTISGIVRIPGDDGVEVRVCGAFAGDIVSSEEFNLTFAVGTGCSVSLLDSGANHDDAEVGLYGATLIQDSQ